MKQAIIDLLSSKKFITTVVGALVAIGGKLGLDLDTELVAAIVAMFTALILAQGAADHGKERARIEQNGGDE